MTTSVHVSPILSIMKNETNANLVYGFKLRIQGITRRMRALSTNDPKRTEMAAKLIELENLIESHTRDEVAR